MSNPTDYEHTVRTLLMEHREDIGAFTGAVMAALADLCSAILIDQPEPRIRAHACMSTQISVLGNLISHLHAGWQEQQGDAGDAFRRFVTLIAAESMTDKMKTGMSRLDAGTGAVTPVFDGFIN